MPAPGWACERQNSCVALQGIPTTRAGSIVTSDTMIVRDPLYTGDPIEERASVVLRIAPSFFRFGSFEIFNHTDIKTGRHSRSGDQQVAASCDPAVLTLQHYARQKLEQIWEEMSSCPELHAIHGDRSTNCPSFWRLAQCQ